MNNRYNLYAPLGIGIDQMFDQLNRGLQKSITYPPHNIIKTSQDKYVLELALAGFNKDGIDITVEGDTLTVKSKKLPQPDEGERELEYLHRGISQRAFTREFQLGEHMNVREAAFTNGILSISLERKLPDELKPRAIAIV
jgi:molecular chaperone IbpA